MFDKLIENFPKILRALTIKRTFLAAMLAGTFVLCYIAWDARSVIVDKVVVNVVSRRSSASITADEITRAESKSLVDRSTLIVGVQLVNVDFKHNTRKTIYLYSDRIVLQTTIETALAMQMSPSPAFIKEDSENNLRLISLMKADFVCYDSKTTLLARMAPEFPTLAPYMCSISIPPYEGNFSGYLNLLLTRVPDAGEVELLRSSARILAHSIFDRELR
jgi:hypothetical protein